MSNVYKRFDEYEEKKWCIYCKEEIEEDKSFVTDEEGKTYHKDCYDLEFPSE